MNKNPVPIVSRAVVSLFVTVLISYPSVTWAAKQYRCAGKIQYRPCHQSIGYTQGTFPSLQSAERRIHENMKRQKKYSSMASEDLYAEVISSNFKKLPKSDGQWRGIIKGNGNIHLTLHLLRAGIQESTKYMGNITLENDQTSFNFISAVPKGKDWTWRISALAK